MLKKVTIGITMGDPAGIGPEITLKTLMEPSIYEWCNPIVIGDVSTLDYFIEKLNIDVKLNVVSKPSEAKYVFGTIDVIDMGLVNMDHLMLGRDSAAGGEAAFAYVKKVIDLALNNEIDATVTNPISKGAINLAGHHYAGHTEIYADLTNTEKYTMMLAHHDFRVVHVSTHVSLRVACDRATKERVLEVITIAHEACKKLGIKEPRIGVAGLNPHSGEGGLFGHEEIEEIIPAINAAKELGMIVDGPVPPDTLFPKARGGWYDIVVAMYHDQGHIPLKLLGFVYDRELGAWDAIEGVNITLGLPIIRTSVDHGTAYDQVGTGKASPLSLINAIDYGVQLAKQRVNEY